MPDEAVAKNPHSGSTRLVNKLVGQRKIVDTLFWVYHLALHAVFGNHEVEVINDHRPVAGLVVANLTGHIVHVGASQVGLHLPLINADASVPIVSICIFKRLPNTGQR